LSGLDPTDPASAGTPPGRTFFPEVESLRGVAILLVFLFHADGLLTGNHGEGQLGSPLAAFVRAGYVGVDLFFVLSGFLLCFPFLAAAEGGRPVSVRRYLERRALRILPMDYVMIAVAAVACARRPADLLHGVPYLFFLISFPKLYTPLMPYSIPWWSLATEVQFYVTLPLLAVFLRSRRLLWFGLGVLATLGVVRIAFLQGWLAMPTVADVLLRLSLFGRGPVFLLGMLAAWVHRRHGLALAARLAASPWVRRGGADAALLGLLVVLGYLLRWVAFLGPEAENGPRHVWHAAAAALWVGVLLLLLLAPLHTKRLFANRALGTVGVLSYSLFLMHLQPLHLVLVRLHGAQGPNPDGWTFLSTATVLLVLAGCLSLSAVTYRVIERPFLVRKAQLG